MQEASTLHSSDDWKRFIKKDDRVRIVVQGSEGVVEARNTGISCAQGKYILLIDEDDCLDVSAIETLVARADAWDLDVLFYTENLVCCQAFKGIYSGLEMLEQFAESKKMFPIHGYMLKTQFLQENQVICHSDRLSEDMVLLFHLLATADRVGVLSSSGFSSRIREETDLRCPEGFQQLNAYLIGLIDMLNVSASYQGEHITEAQIRVINSVRASIGNIWSSLSEEEKRKTSILSDNQKAVLYYCLISDRQEKELKDQYEDQLSTIKETLQRTYREKSEINANLQRTYKEKFDRGVQIKELSKSLIKNKNERDILEKKLEEIKTSKTYQVVSIIGKIKRRIAKQ